jgi:hypothetical protein
MAQNQIAGCFKVQLILFRPKANGADIKANLLASGKIIAEVSQVSDNIILIHHFTGKTALFDYCIKITFSVEFRKGIFCSRFSSLPGHFYNSPPVFGRDFAITVIVAQFFFRQIKSGKGHFIIRHISSPLIVSISTDDDKSCFS